MSVIWQLLGAFGASFFFSIYLFATKKFLIYCGLTGLIGWMAYLAALGLGFGTAMAYFWASLVISLVSHLFARVLKAPVTEFLIPGLLPLVPGASIYRAVYYLMEGDGQASMQYLGETLLLAGAIAAAVFLVDSLIRVFKLNFRVR